MLRLALVFIIATLIPLAFLGCGEDNPVDTEIDQSGEDIPGFDFELPCPVAGFSPDYLFVSGVARDGIPPIEHPTFSPVSQVEWLSDDDRVVGIVLDGQALAFPVRMLTWHEVVNLEGNGGKSALTYCPLTFTGIFFDLERAFPGLRQSLGVSGLLYNSNLVLYDRKTESFWPQMSGSAYAGKSAGMCLDYLPVTDTTLRFWKTLYPNTKVLDRPGKATTWGKYNLDPYQSYWSNEDVLYPVRHPLDPRLSSKEWVLGILSDRGQKVFPIDNAKVVNDSLPGVPFVVFTHTVEKTMVAFKAWINDGERLIFSPAAIEGGAPTYTDDRTGSTWNFKGECINGSLAGSVLERMPSYFGFHFAWTSFFPESEIYETP